MKRTSMKTLVFAGLLALLIAPVAVYAAGNDSKSWGPPCGGHPPVPPFFAEKYDANHDGKLSDAEMKAANEAFLKAYDKDKDGRISFEEMKAVHVDEGKALFAAADTNKDGMITADEFNAQWAKMPGPGGGPRGHHKGWFWEKGERPCGK
jgi:hypothetical protein